jgi:hypothetical protein
MATAKKEVVETFTVLLTLSQEEAEFLLVAMGDAPYLDVTTSIYTALKGAGVLSSDTARQKYIDAYTHLTSPASRELRRP